MLIVNHLIRFVVCVLSVGGSVVLADPAVDRNTTRSNRAGATGGGSDVTETDLNISNDKIVRKRPGRQSSSDMTPDSDLSQRGSGTVKFFNNSKGFRISASIQDGAGDLPETDLNISNDKIVRKRPGRQSSSDMTPDSDLSQRGSGTVEFFNDTKGSRISAADQANVGTLRNNDPIPGIDIIVEKDSVVDSAIANSIVMLYYQLLLEGASDSEAIEYGLIAALMADSDAIEYGLIAALMGEVPENQLADADEIIVRKKPGRVADTAELSGGLGDNASGTHRKNDPIPEIDVIVERDSEEDPAMYDSPLVMLNEMLKAGYSQAEVVDFALATGLLGG